MRELLVESGAVIDREPGARRVPRLRIGLAGCGVVGGAFARLIAADHARAFAARSLVPELATVLVRDPERPRTVDVPRDLLTPDTGSFLAADVDVIVEATGDVPIALDIARAALGRGVPFITANKTLVAAHGPELDRLARANGAFLAFEAAVAAGVPVVRTIRDGLAGAHVTRIRGILNGTANYVLCMLERSMSLDAAIAAARENGYAEADASRDLDGRDAADKIRILAWLAFGVDPAQVPLTCRGILPDPEALMAAAAARGGRVRLIAACERTPDGVVANVAPVVLPKDSPFAATIGAENRIEIETENAGCYALAGPGAGGAETAVGLLADLLAPPRRRQPATGPRASLHTRVGSA